MCRADPCKGFGANGSGGLERAALLPFRPWYIRQEVFAVAPQMPPAAPLTSFPPDRLVGPSWMYPSRSCATCAARGRIMEPMFTRHDEQRICSHTHALHFAISAVIDPPASTLCELTGSGRSGARASRVDRRSKIIACDAAFVIAKRGSHSSLDRSIAISGQRYQHPMVRTL